MASLIAPVIAAGTLARLSQPVFDLNDIVLRPWRPADAAAVATAYADPGIRRWHGRTMTEVEAREWIATWQTRWQAETGAGWAIINRPDTNDSGPIGQVGLRRLNLAEGCAEVSYWMTPSA